MSNDAFAFVVPALIFAAIVGALIVAGVTSLIWWMFI